MYYSNNITKEGPFIYKDFIFGRLIFKTSAPNRVIMIRNNNTVIAGAFYSDNMPNDVKVAFRPKK